MRKKFPTRLFVLLAILGFFVLGIWVTVIALRNTVHIIRTGNPGLISAGVLLGVAAAVLHFGMFRRLWYRNTPRLTIALGAGTMFGLAAGCGAFLQGESGWHVFGMGATAVMIETIVAFQDYPNRYPTHLRSPY